MSDPIVPRRREVYQLPEGHGWSAAPGHKILVIDAGAVLLEYPAAWLAEPTSNQVNLRDGPNPAESTCTLAVSCHRLPRVDWSGLPLSRLLVDAQANGESDVISTGPVIEIGRNGLALAWNETRLVDPGEHREARSRMCLARGQGVQCLITFDYWPEDEPLMTPVWDHALESLKLGVRVEAPLLGRRIE